MSYDLAESVLIPSEILEMRTTEAGRDLLDEVKQCFDYYPGVLKLIGNMAGVHQPLTGEGQDIMINEGKRQLFLQLLSLIAAAQIEPEKAASILKGEHDV